MDNATNAVRAWKDRDYREELTAIQRSAIPDHPAGDIDARESLLDGVRGGESTEYVFTFGCCQGITSACEGFTQSPCTSACNTFWMSTTTVCNPT